MGDDDRRVHAVTGRGCEVVRYDRAGKWYLENLPNRGRGQIRLADAVSLAANPGAVVHFGIPGGTTFDRKVRRRLDER